MAHRRTRFSVNDNNGVTVISLIKYRLFITVQNDQTSQVVILPKIISKNCVIDINNNAVNKNHGQTIKFAQKSETLYFRSSGRVTNIQNSKFKEPSKISIL